MSGGVPEGRGSYGESPAGLCDGHEAAARLKKKKRKKNYRKQRGCGEG